MRTASARALWPFFVRFSAPSPAWIARAGRAGAARGIGRDRSSALARFIVLNYIYTAADFLSDSAGAWLSSERDSPAERVI